MPTAQPASAAANQIQPCSEPDATPPTNAPMLQPKPSRAPHPISSPPSAAAASDFSGGQAPRANGRIAAAAMAPKIMPKSVRLEVSLGTESASARLGPGHCQNDAVDRSTPSALAILPPHSVKPKVTLQGWRPKTKTAIEMSPIATAPMTIASGGLIGAPRQRATATTSVA